MGEQRAPARHRAARPLLAVAAGGLLAASGALLTGCSGGAPDGAVQAEVMAAVKVNGRAGSLAGISARGGIDVPAYRARQFGADTAGQGFHEFRRRCATCHAAPRPDLHPAAEWPGVLTRMEAAMSAAGVLGLSPDERAVILELLQRHAKQ